MRAALKLAIAASLVLMGPAQAQSLKEKYELSERCGKLATEHFEKYSSSNPFAVYYENHYNSRLNKCFYLETKERRNSQSKLLNLLDLHENRTIATYGTPAAGVSGLCVVQGKQCSSEEEWRALIKPFMED